MSDRASAKAQAQQKTLIGSSPKSSLLRRTCACGQHTIAGGECEACRKTREGAMQRSAVNSATVNAVPPVVHDVLSSPGQLLNAGTRTFMEPRFGHDFSQIPIHSTKTAVPQTKLGVSQPGDVYEQEADQVAEQVMRMTDVEFPLSDGEDEAENSLLRKQAGEPGAIAATQSPDVPPIVHDVLNEGGERPLDTTTRAFMEPRFGRDFSQVRVHTDERAAESARAVNALAYTVGQDIVFGTGQFASGTEAGRRLLAHELAHVVQQTRSGAGTPAIARTPGPVPGAVPQVRHNGLTDAEKKLLNEVRQRLVGDDEKATAIVGVLIAEDGRQFELRSGGGQGFSSHVEGKATDIMNELGITKATLLVEKEPCQICDRSVYPGGQGPEVPLRSSRTGKPIDRQTPKINTALPIGSELTVVDPEAAAIYRGVKSVSGTTPSTPKPAVTTPKVPPETSTDVSVPKAGTMKTATEPEPTVTTPKVSLETPVEIPVPKVGPAKIVTAPEPTITTPEVPTETPAEVHSQISKSGDGTAIGAFQIALLLIQMFVPDPIEGQAIQTKLNQEWNSPKWQSRLNALQPEIAHSDVSVYYNIKFKVLYSVTSSPKPQALPDFYSVEGVEILEINLSKAKSQDCGKMDPSQKPENAAPVLGGGFYWKAQRICTATAEITGAKRLIGPTYGLKGDTEIRNALIAADAATIAQIPTGEKVRIINRLFDGWVSDADIGAIRKIYKNTPSSQRPAVKQAIEQRILDLTDIGQRTQVRVILAGE